MTATTAPRPRDRRVTRALGLGLVAVATVVSLSACIKMDATLNINSDAKATGSLSLSFQKQAASFMGMTSLDDFSKGITQDDMSGDALNGLGDCTPSETDTDFVYSCTFTDAAFTEAGGPWTIAKEGQSIVMTVVNEGQAAGGEDASALLGDASLGTITVDATFPGPITEVTGTGATKTSDTSVTITGKLTDPMNVTVRSDTSSSSSWGLLLVILIALAVILLIVIVAVVLIVRRRKTDTEADAVDAMDPADVAVPVAAAAVVEETVVDETGDAETVVEETIVEETGDGETAVTEVIAVDETVVQETVVEETVVEETVADRPATDEPTA